MLTWHSCWSKYYNLHKRSKKHCRIKRSKISTFIGLRVVQNIMWLRMKFILQETLSFHCVTLIVLESLVTNYEYLTYKIFYCYFVSLQTWSFPIFETKGTNALTKDEPRMSRWQCFQVHTNANAQWLPCFSKFSPSILLSFAFFCSSVFLFVSCLRRQTCSSYRLNFSLCWSLSDTT